jgi:hypothetical protein
MNRGRLLISLAVAGALSVGLGSSLPSAGAERRVVVTLTGGEVLVFTGELPCDPSVAGALATQVASVSCEELTPGQPAPAPPSTSTQPPGAAPPEPPQATVPTRSPSKRAERRPDRRQAATRLGAKRVESLRAQREERTDAKRRSDGVPTPANPTFALADPGPAPIGVPNFFIDKFRIPPFLLRIYQAAGIEYDVPWQVLAAINEIETDYGRNLNVSSAGAMGWMQFIPSSWKAYGVDANDDGKADPYNPVDAIFAAARYLKAAGAQDDLHDAIYAYNHAEWYVQSVLLRAKLIRALPEDLVGALTGLTQGHFPVAGAASYPREDARRRDIVIAARPGARVVAANDGIVKRIGVSRRLGRHVVLQDVYGNTYTYAGLGSVAPVHPAPRPGAPAHGEAAETHDEHRDPRPSRPATAGLQPAPAARRSDAPRTPTGGGARVRVAKARLFANPARPRAFRAGGDRQLVQQATDLPEGAKVSSYSTVPLPRHGVVLRPLRAGSQVLGGTVIGQAERDGRLGFAVRPAGDGAPAVDPKPVLDGWRLLDSTHAHRGRALRAAALRNPSIGQLMLMTKQQLIRRVLSDPRIDIYGCGRRDVAVGAIDRRVLATLAYLAASRLSPRVSALECGHSYYTAAGGVSAHSSGNAVDIAAINGKPILGNQGRGSITDRAIRRLLTLQGSMKPNQIISLMKFEGTDNTLSMSDHHDHIHVGFDPRNGGRTSRSTPAAVLKPGQWVRLMDRLGRIDNPRVPGADLPELEPRPGKVRVRLRVPRSAPKLSSLPPRG